MTLLINAHPDDARPQALRRSSRTGDSAWGYEDTKPGEEFPRIGVGALRRPKGESAYRRYGIYEIVDPGKWHVTSHEDRVEFTHTLKVASSGYGYVYRKIVRLVPGKPELEVSHSLKNIGSKPIETSQYSHNFFAMDDQRLLFGPISACVSHLLQWLLAT